MFSFKSFIVSDLMFRSFFVYGVRRASLVAQLVKNPRAMQETLVWGLGRSPGEGIGYPLQCSWASLVAQMVKNPSTCTVGDLGSIPGLGRCPGGGQRTPVFLPGESPWTEEPGGLQSKGSQRVRYN